MQKTLQKGKRKIKINIFKKIITNKNENAINEKHIKYGAKGVIAPKLKKI